MDKLIEYQILTPLPNNEGGKYIIVIAKNILEAAKEYPEAFTIAAKRKIDKIINFCN